MAGKRASSQPDWHRVFGQGAGPVPRRPVRSRLHPRPANATLAKPCHARVRGKTRLERCRAG